MAAFGPDKDSDGKTLTTHADKPGFAIVRSGSVDTSTSSNNVYFKKYKNREERRKEEKLSRSRKKPSRIRW
jgi:hypothetical protein